MGVSDQLYSIGAIFTCFLVSAENPYSNDEISPNHLVTNTCLPLRKLGSGPWFVGAPAKAYARDPLTSRRDHLFVAFLLFRLTRLFRRLRGKQGIPHRRHLLHPVATFPGTNINISFLPPGSIPTKQPTRKDIPRETLYSFQPWIPSSEFPPPFPLWRWV